MKLRFLVCLGLLSACGGARHEEAGARFANHARAECVTESGCEAAHAETQALIARCQERGDDCSGLVFVGINLDEQRQQFAAQREAHERFAANAKRDAELHARVAQGADAQRQADIDREAQEKESTAEQAAKDEAEAARALEYLRLLGPKGRADYLRKCYLAPGNNDDCGTLLTAMLAVADGDEEKRKLVELNEKYLKTDVRMTRGWSKN